MDASSEALDSQAATDVADEVHEAPIGPPPRSYLVASLLVAALLFLPTGVVAVVFSLRSRVLTSRGDLGRARWYSRAALASIIVTTVIGLIVYAALIGALLGLGAFSGSG